MVNITCPYCKGSNVSQFKDKVNPDRKLFIPTIEIGNDGNNKIIADQGFAFDAYLCNDCKVAILTAPCIQNP